MTEHPQAVLSPQNVKGEARRSNDVACPLHPVRNPIFKAKLNLRQRLGWRRDDERVHGLELLEVARKRREFRFSERPVTPEAQEIKSSDRPVGVARGSEKVDHRLCGSVVVRLASDAELERL